MRHLRSQARKLGLKIQTRRATGSEPVRYRVVDPATNAPIGADLLGLDDVQTRLWWIVREREREGAGEPPVVEETERCPVCGTPRMGFFRLCMTCGLDYEAQVKPSAALVQTSSNGVGNGTHQATAPRPLRPTEPPLVSATRRASGSRSSHAGTAPGPERHDEHLGSRGGRGHERRAGGSGAAGGPRGP